MTALITGAAFLAGIFVGFCASRRDANAFGDVPVRRLEDAAELNAYVAGRFTRSLATEAFERRNIAAMHDHDEMVRHWKNEPGWLDGYLEATQ